MEEEKKKPRSGSVVKRVLVIDLPDSGQAAVGYAKRLNEGRLICGRNISTGSGCLYK